MRSISRRLIGLVEFLFGVAIFAGVIKHLIEYGMNIQLRAIPPAAISLGFIYYGKKYLFNEVNILEDIKDIKIDQKSYTEIIDKAQNTLPIFIQKIKEEKDEYYISFAIEDSKKNVVQVWGIVHNYSGNLFNVTIVSSLNKKDKVETSRVNVLESAVLDWMIKGNEGKTYGAYLIQKRAEIARLMGYRLDRKSKKYLKSIALINIT